MNNEIVRILEREFPAPVKVEDGISSLISVLHSAIPLNSARSSDALNRLALGIDGLVEDVVHGRIVGVDEEARNRLRVYWERQQEDIAEADDFYESLDEQEQDSFLRYGNTAKYVDLDEIAEDEV